jgi:cell division septum initiation protein DivIVA
MDILHLVDRLEELFNESRPIPLTHNVIINEDKILDIIDQMRVTIPDEMKKAQQVLTQRDRVLAQAQEEANRTLALAREKSERLLERESLTQAAKVQADEIISKALSDAERSRRDADKYVIDTLMRIEYELEKMLNQARNGILALQSIAEKEETQQMAEKEIAQESPGI